MTAPVEGFVEAEKAMLAFQIALTTLGVKTIGAALRLWATVPANKAAEVADQWMDSAVKMIMTRRAISRDLAVAYYRLARALRTGTTIPDPDDVDPETVTMAQLREEFQRAVDVAMDDAPTTDTPSDDSGDPEPSQRASARIPKATAKERAEVPDDTEIPVETFDGTGESGDKEDAETDDAAEKEIRVVLKALGTNNLAKKVSEIDHDAPAKDVDGQRDDVHKKVGARQAAAADRLVKNGGRAKVKSLADKDPKVIGYVRFSTTGTPCGWCAMLISRGLVLYRSAESAEGKTSRAKTVKDGDAMVGDLYHDNCKCMAVPVYSRKDYNKSEEFGLNREYAELWPSVTKGKSDKAALAAWRKYFRANETAGDEDTGDAQVA